MRNLKELLIDALIGLGCGLAITLVLAALSRACL
jgi:hypothetical protein